jgi:hypothetical protein
MTSGVPCQPINPAGSGSRWRRKPLEDSHVRVLKPVPNDFGVYSSSSLITGRASSFEFTGERREYAAVHEELRVEGKRCGQNRGERAIIGHFDQHV